MNNDKHMRYRAKTNETRYFGIYQLTLEVYLNLSFNGTILNLLN